MKGGWFIGDFEPSCLLTKECEVAHKKYKRGGSEQRHVHKIANEITLIASGKVLMNGKEYGEGDIVHISPGESTDFKALTDASTVVVKIPSVKGDKYLE